MAMNIVPVVVVVIIFFIVRPLFHFVLIAPFTHAIALALALVATAAALSGTKSRGEG